MKINSSNGQRKQPDYNPVKETGEGKLRRIINLDDEYREYEQRVIVTEKILLEFANLIKRSFALYEIRGYFDSNPRLGTLGHAVTEKVHDLFIQHGAVEHSIETETEDALVQVDPDLFQMGRPDRNFSKTLCDKIVCDESGCSHERRG